MTLHYWFKGQTGSNWLRWWDSVGLVLWWEKSGRTMWLIWHCIAQVSLELIYKSISLCIYYSFVPIESGQLISLLPSPRYCIVLDWDSIDHVKENAKLFWGIQTGWVKWNFHLKELTFIKPIALVQFFKTIWDYTFSET